MLLRYEEEVLRECDGQSCLLVMAGGLNIQGIMVEMARQYLNKNSLALLVNFSGEDESLLLRTESPFLHDIRALQRPKRREKYLCGGVCIASNRVFLADMIDGTIDAEKIDCILVNNVETITETSSESFIIHVFRSRNRTGLIRGFSESPVPLSLGFSPLDRKMRSLKVSKAVFFPRFHSLVEESLNGDMDVVEIKFRMSERKSQLQVVLLEIIGSLLRMVFRGSGREEVDPETIIFGSIHKIFKQMSVSNNRIMEDLYDMRGLVFLLFSSDPGSFYGHVKEVVRKQVELEKDSTWINLPVSHVLVDKAQEQFEEAVEKTKGLDGEDDCGGKEGERAEETVFLPGLSNARLRAFYALNPKIKKLVEVLQEVKEAPSVVLVSNHVVKRMLSRVLVAFDLASEESLEKCNGVLKIMTHYEFKYYGEEYENVIFVESGQDSVRKIERYGVAHSVKVFFLMHTGSLEEQRYLNEIRREKASFEKLIEERSRLPLRLDDVDDAIDLEEYEPAEREYVVVVDSRELRAELPFFLFRARNRICISTLPVGDYLVSPTTCIERKSIPDLVSSLNSGRLYLQASMLCHRYPRPVLLLEFDGRPCLSDYYRYDQDTFKNSLVAKLSLLLFNLGALRLIWSESRLFSTKIIRDLQRKEDVSSAVEGHKMDPVLHEILLSIPGITQFNISRVRRYFRSLKDLVFSTMERLEVALGRENSALIYDFFRQEVGNGNKTNGEAGERPDG